VTQFAAIGTNARRHLWRLGVRWSRLGHAPYCVDSDELERQYLQWSPQRESLRRELNVGDGDYVLIFSGKLIPKKQPLLLIEAIALLPDVLRTRIHLIVMGDGEQRAEVERQGRALLGRRLHLAGFVNQSQMGRWYAGSDCLVLPSRRGAGETWGLVVNEALQFGVPVIASDGVGCVPDFAASGACMEFQASDPAQLANAIGQLMAERVSPDSCRRVVRAFSLAAAHDGLVTAVYRAAKIIEPRVA